MNKKTTPVLYYDPTSEPARAIYWWAKEAKVPLQVKLTWLGKGQHLSKEFLDVNPRHQVPALKHQNFNLSETTAIFSYLSEINQISEQWFGNSPQERAYVQMLLSWYHTNFRQKVIYDYFLPMFIAPYYQGEAQPDPTKIWQLRKNFSETMQQFNEFLKEKKFFLGDKISVVDFLYAGEIFSVKVDPEFEQVFGQYKNIMNWMENMRNFPFYDDSHYTIDKILIPKIRKYLETKQKDEINEWIKQETERYLKMDMFIQE